MQLQDYKNIASLGICTVSLIACILHYYQKADTLFRVFPLCMGVYFAGDLTVNKLVEYRIHHIASLGIVFYTYYYGVNAKEIESLTYHFLKTELSTFFLVFRYYLPKGTLLYKTNNYIFYALFTKVRIIDLYQNVILPNSQIYTVIQTYTPNNRLGSSILLSSCYVLYGLNLYWFSIMNRHLYVQLTSGHKAK
jgi:TLC domain